MESIKKAEIVLQHWIAHNDHHQEEYETFADQLEELGKAESAGYIREMKALTSKATELLKKALKELE